MTTPLTPLEPRLSFYDLVGLISLGYCTEISLLHSRGQANIMPPKASSLSSHQSISLFHSLSKVIFQSTQAMANNALALYTSSSSTYNLEGVPHSINLVLESTFVKEEAKAITMAPHAILPPPISRASGDTSVKSTARTKAS